MEWPLGSRIEIERLQKLLNGGQIKIPFAKHGTFPCFNTHQSLYLVSAGTETRSEF